MSFDRLIEKIAEKQNPTVVGLDPKLSFIPAYIKEKAFSEYGSGFSGAAAAILEYNCGIIDAIADIVPAVKPQAAYYEMYGWQGVKTLAQTIEYAKNKGLYVILDGKRNDIGTTVEAYGSAYLGKTELGDGHKESAFGADSLTINGYLGTDGIKPLLDICLEEDKGIIVLVKTSNPSSGEMQDMILETGKTVYHTMAEMAENWGSSLPGKYQYSGVGAVVGATYPEQLQELRENFPNTFFLVPGYGAQGGTAADIVPGFDKNGLGAIINSSRAVLCAWQKENCPEEDYANASRREALRMKEEILSQIGEIQLSVNRKV